MPDSVLWLKDPSASRKRCKDTSKSMELPLDMTPTRPMRHYEVTEIAPLHYTFTTEGGSQYELSFVSSSELGDIPIYAFNIGRSVKGQETESNKELVRNTVAHVLHLFFLEVDNAILSTCEVDDGMQNARKRLFDRWFKELAPEEILVMDGIIDAGIAKTWATMYYHRDNMFRSILESNFREYQELMNSLSED